MKRISFLVFILVKSSWALSPLSQEKLHVFRSPKGTFEEMRQVFEDVARNESVSGSVKSVPQIVKELQVLDPDFATEIVLDQDYFKISFLLDQGWDPTLANSRQRNLMQEAVLDSTLAIQKLLLRTHSKKFFKDAKISTVENFLRRTDPEFSEYQVVLLRRLILESRSLSVSAGQIPDFNVDGVSRADVMEMAPRAPPPSGGRVVYPYIRVGVPYATNRGFDASLKRKIGTPTAASNFYSFNSSGSLGYGVAEVTIPKIHKHSRLESPGLFQSADPRKHIILDRLILKSEADFFSDLRARFKPKAEASSLVDDPSQNIFVYIHGFNVDFTYAMRKTAQLIYDIEFPGVSVAFSWPARAVGLPVPEDFRRDVARAEESYEALENFLKKLREENPNRKIHILAHSLGTRILSEVLTKMADNLDPADRAQLGRGEKLFGEIVLAAPAIDAKPFVERMAPQLERLSERISIFASDDDMALKAQTIAEKLESFPLGLIAKNRWALPEHCVNFDLSSLSSGTFSLDHAVYSEVRGAMAQLHRIFVSRTPTEKFGDEDQRQELFLRAVDINDYFPPQALRSVWRFIGF